ncbi:hypothetical protein [Enhygromyxa salina]|uniref:Uncharacterized protein n=1 Tax=Enhygromyxa salina TaxID=215803 RepID=A0A2S9YCA4_9BACT|nr:hypothetical protein [Enhygromyxa salina]PRQ02656.1 hypothetical protein ENSA7_54850 [Enhygromyxa salina]
MRTMRTEGLSRVFLSIASLGLLGATSCGSPDPAASEATTSTDGESTQTTETTGDGDGDGDADTCRRNVVIMGYWPPTNEMLRPWSRNPEQNPDGWTGENWQGHGYDVYAFFPEFPPDGDPTNDQLGDPGAVGSPESDLQVDYQDTSADFWRIVDEYEPVILITTSRGGDIGWEIEAVEGGHDGGTMDPADDWASDRFGEVTQPTQASVEPRSWAGISTYRQGQQLPSQLPIEAIRDAALGLGSTSVQIDQGTSGNFLSGFLGLHGLLYNAEAAHNVAAGHIHVGFSVPTPTARALIEASLQVVLEAHPLDCGS